MITLFSSIAHEINYFKCSGNHVEWFHENFIYIYVCKLLTFIVIKTYPPFVYVHNLSITNHNTWMVETNGKQLHSRSSRYLYTICITFNSAWSLRFLEYHIDYYHFKIYNLTWHYITKRHITLKKTYISKYVSIFQQ